MTNQDEKTTIQISKQLRDFLFRQAIYKDESFEEILRRLLPLPKKVAGTSIKKPMS